MVAQKVGRRRISELEAFGLSALSLENLTKVGIQVVDQKHHKQRGIRGCGGEWQCPGTHYPKTRSYFGVEFKSL